MLLTSAEPGGAVGVAVALIVKLAEREDGLGVPSPIPYRSKLVLPPATVTVTVTSWVMAGPL